MNDSTNASSPDAPSEQPAEMSLEETLAWGIQLHQTGRLPEAERVYRAILAAVPEQVDALHFLGLLLHQAGFDDEAIELMRRAVTLCPEYVDAHSNLGNVLRAQGRLAEATSAYRRAIALAPDRAQAYNNLGVVLKDQGQDEEAIAALRQAIVLDPNRGEAHFNLANLLGRHGRKLEAVAEFRRAFELQPLLVQVYDALSRELRGLGRRDEAIEVWQQLGEQLPENPVVRHMLAATTGNHLPAQASEGYIQETFDRFADGFDHILEALEYQAPAMIAAAMASESGNPERKLEVLDAGCGTGLCGPILRPYARQMVGVDLSGGMLAKARRRELYDQLVQAELTGFLREHPRSYDVIASADTLVYFGDLSGVLTAAAGALRESGLLMFTVEDAGQQASELGYRLLPHGRYSHNESYVEKALLQAGLKVRSITHGTLRMERGEPVAGLVAVARQS